MTVKKVIKRLNELGFEKHKNKPLSMWDEWYDYLYQYKITDSFFINVYHSKTDDYNPKDILILELYEETECCTSAQKFYDFVDYTELLDIIETELFL